MKKIRAGLAMISFPVVSTHVAVRITWLNPAAPGLTDINGYPEFYTAALLAVDGLAMF